MFYFLVILIPFGVTMCFLVRHMYKLRREYVITRLKVLELIEHTNIELSDDLLELPDDLIISSLVIKKLEKCLKPIEAKIDRNFVFISNKNIPKKQKLIKLRSKVKMLKSHLSIE